jgi:hypothetical protein
MNKPTRLVCCREWKIKIAVRKPPNKFLNVNYAFHFLPIVEQVTFGIHIILEVCHWVAWREACVRELFPGEKCLERERDRVREELCLTDESSRELVRLALAECHCSLRNNISFCEASILNTDEILHNCLFQYSPYTRTSATQQQLSANALCCKCDINVYKKLLLP